MLVYSISLLHTVVKTSMDLSCSLRSIARFKLNVARGCIQVFKQQDVCDMRSREVVARNLGGKTRIDARSLNPKIDPPPRRPGDFYVNLR